MSINGAYILSYENQPYDCPTPMDFDKLSILAEARKEFGQDQKIEFIDLQSGFTIYFEWPRWWLNYDFFSCLKADKIFCSTAGEPFQVVR